MSTLTIRVLEGGERAPFLLDDSGVPMFYPTLFTTVRLRNAGAAVNTTNNPTNYSGCSVYTPCEPQLGHTGRFAETEPTFDDGADGEVLIAKDVPIGLVRTLRNGEAEVWPGGWTAGHVSVTKIG